MLSTLRSISRNIRCQAEQCYSISRRQCYAAQAAAASVANNDNQAYMAVTWADGKTDKYPHLYLRENCRCSQCYKEAYNSRIMFVPKTIDKNISAKSIDLKTGGDIGIEWKDGHSSNFSPELLKELRYREPGEAATNGVLKEGVRLWGSELGEGQLPVFDFEKVINDDEELYRWLVTLLRTVGIAKFVNIPKKTGQLKKLGAKVGYLASTFYGVSEYEIRAHSTERSKDIGYSTSALPIHTDYSFCSTSPAVSLFHCIEQTESKGGENIFSDGFHAAKILHEEDPEGFKLLTAPIRFNNVTQTEIGKYHNIVYRKTISLDRDGRVQAVTFSDEFRDADMPHPPEFMDAFYRAYFRFSELMHDPRTSFHVKMVPGEMFSVNNHRLLHGRNEYEDIGANVRHLQLGFLDWDCANAKLRLMAREKGVESPID